MTYTGADKMSDALERIKEDKIALQAKRIAELEQPWISVEDRLPELGEWCLLAQGSEILLDVWCRCQDKYSHPELGWRWEGMDLENMALATDWMPLPAPPQEQTK